MGTTFSNIHVKIGDHTPETVMSAIEDVLKHSQFEGIATRTFTIITDEKSQWVTIYDSAFMSLKDLPILLSGMLGSVIEISVHDSDVLQMRLCQDGQIQDIYCDWSKYDQLPRIRIGNASAWEAVLPDGVTTAQLEAAWQPNNADMPFQSEGILYRVMNLLKLEEWRVWDNRDRESLPPSARIMELNVPAKMSPYDNLAQGLPVLISTSYVDDKIVSPDSSWGIYCAFLNMGGHATGINIVCRGEAIVDGLVVPTGIITEPPLDYRIGNSVASPERIIESNDVIRYQFLLPDYEIRAGLADWNIAPPFLDPKKDSSLQQSFTVVIQAKQQGTAELTIAMIPTTNPVGQVEVKFRVKVK